MGEYQTVRNPGTPRPFDEDFLLCENVNWPPGAKRWGIQQLPQRRLPGLTLNFSAARMDKNGCLQWMELPAKVSIKNPKSVLSWKNLFEIKTSESEGNSYWAEEHLALYFSGLLFWRASQCWILQWRWLSWWGNYGVDTKCKWSTQMMSGFEAQLHLSTIRQTCSSQI